MVKERPLLTGERVQLRLAGQKPVFICDADSLAIVVDPAGLSRSSSSTSNQATFTIRRGPQAIVGLSAISGGSVMDVGSIANPSPTYLSMRTSGTDGTTDGSIAMTERFKVGPGNQVSTPEGCDFIAGGNLLVQRDVTILGGLYASSYLNLIDDFRSPSLLHPPTANALRNAFTTLSNLIQISKGNTNDESICFDAGHSESFNVPSVACIALDAISYCNLVQDFYVSDISKPPSAAALQASFSHLSNYIALEAHKWRFGSQHPEAYFGDYTHGEIGTKLLTDTWMDGGGVPRMWLPGKESELPTQLLTPAKADNQGDAFQWRTWKGGDGESMGMPSDPLMNLTHKGGLILNTLQLKSNCDIAGTLSTTHISAQSAQWTHMTAGSIIVQNTIDVRGGYCNLPRAEADGQTWGIVRLQTSDQDLAKDNGIFQDLPSELLVGTAASLAGLRDVDRSSRLRDESIRDMIGEACYSAEFARQVATEASNTVHRTLAYAPSNTYQRTINSNGAVDFITLRNSSAVKTAGARIQMVVGEQEGEQATGSIELKRDEMTLKGPSSTHITLNDTGSVDIQTDIESPFRTFPVLPSPDTSAMEVTSWQSEKHPEITFTARASTIYNDSTMPVNAFMDTHDFGWVSRYGTYSIETGYPLRTAATTETLPMPFQLQTISTVQGEWLELDISQPITVDGLIISAANYNNVPDDFVVIGRDARDAQWHIMFQATEQAETLQEAGSQGCMYELMSAWSVLALRLIITRVRIINTINWGVYESFAQVKRVMFKNSKATSDLAWTINKGDIFSVGRNARIGCGLGRNNVPMAALHVRVVEDGTAAARIEQHGNAFDLRIDNKEDAPSVPRLCVDLPTREAGFAIRDNDGFETLQVQTGLVGINGNVDIAGHMDVTGDLMVTQALNIGSNMNVHHDIRTSHGALISGSGEGTGTRAETRVVQRKRVQTLSGLSFVLDRGLGYKQHGIVQDISSLDTGTAGLVSGRLSRSPVDVKWIGNFSTPIPRECVFTIQQAEAPAILKIGGHVLWTFGSLIGSNLEPPVQLTARLGDSPAQVTLPDAETIVQFRLTDHFIEPQADWMQIPDVSEAALTFELIADPDNVLVLMPSSNASNGEWQARGGYRGRICKAKVKSTSLLTGLSIETDIEFNDPLPPPPHVIPLGSLTITDAQPREVVTLDLSKFFEDATRPTSGLLFTIESGYATVDTNILQIEPDFRGRQGYTVMVRATSKAFPESFAFNSITVSEPWPVVRRYTTIPFQSVYISDNFTPVNISIDSMSHFIDLAGMGLVFTAECDIEGAVLLNNEPPSNSTRDIWDTEPAFPSAEPMFSPPSPTPSTLSIFGNYRNSDYKVVLVATSVKYPFMSARCAIQISESAAPAPERLMESLGQVTLDWMTQVFRTDLRAAFIDMTLQGMSFEVEDAPDASILEDGFTLEVRGAFRCTNYQVKIFATGQPYRAKQEFPVIIDISESCVPPKAKASNEQTVIRMSANSDIPTAVPLHERFETMQEWTLSYEIMTPAFDNLIIDPITQYMMVRGVPNTDETYEVTVRATDDFGQYADAILKIENIAPPSLTGTHPDTLQVGKIVPTRQWFSSRDTLIIRLDPCSIDDGILLDGNDMLFIPNGTYNDDTVRVYASDSFGQSVSIEISIDP